MITEADRELLLESLKTYRKNQDTGKLEVTAPNPPEWAIRQLQETCERLGITWKDRHVYLMERMGKWRPELSIDGFRLIASRSPDYDGQAGPFWATGPEGPWTDIPPAVQPYAAKVGIRRKGQAEPVWGVAKFSDYADLRSPLWKKQGPTMIAKCAEMLGLRKALPAELSGLYGVEEMQQIDRPENVRNRKSTPKAEESDAEPEGEVKLREAYAAFVDRINDCQTLDSLRIVGKEIQNSHLGVPNKVELNKQYQAKKEKEGWT